MQADQSATINVKLEVGAASDSVTVEATAVQVDTTTETLRQVVDNARMPGDASERPQCRRVDFFGGRRRVVNALSPSQADQGKTKTFPVAVTISTNGTRQNQVSYRLDGAENIDNLSNVNAPFPAPDALQEFSVQTSNYSAEFGQNAGGVVNVVTKSGTNSFHGDAYGFLRNAVFNARNFFASQRDPLKRGQFGGSAGGPIIKDKTFFFAEYQGTTVRSKQGGQSASVPTAANLAGDFSAFLSATDPNNPQGRVVLVRDPLNGQPFPNNQIPVNRLDPASLNLTKFLPQVGGNGLVFFANPDVENFAEAMVRVDHTISSKDRIFVRYFDDRYNFDPVLTNNNLLTYSTGSHIPYQNWVLRETHIFRPNLLNDFRFSYFREGDVRTPPPNSPNLADFGVQGLWLPPQKAIESISVSGFFTFGSASQSYIPRQRLLPGATMCAGSSDATAFPSAGRLSGSRFDIDTIFNANGRLTFSGDSTGLCPRRFRVGQNADIHAK